MYVYLQPFHTKGLIDEANARLLAHGETLSAGDNLTMRVRYAVATFTGLAQTIYYLALWTFSTLATFATLGLIKAIDRFGDEAGSLAMASMVGTHLAAFSVVYLPAATVLSQKITAYVDASFQGILTHAKVSLDFEIKNARRVRKSQAANRDEVTRTDLYFDPMVTKMESERTALIRECRKAYPKEIDAKFEAYRISKAKLKHISNKQSAIIRETPFSQREIDKFMVQKIAFEAEEGTAKLFQHCLDVWGTRVRTWGQKFDREVFCRHCLKEFQSARVNKKVERFIRDVKEADNKERAFRESEDGLQRFFSEMTTRVDRLDRPWLHVRLWRRIFPSIDSWRLCKALDRWIDPEMAFLTQAE